MTFQQNKNKDKSFCFKCLITFFLNECLRSLTYLVIALVHNNSNFFSNANDSLSLKFYERVCCRQFIHNTFDTFDCSRKNWLHITRCHNSFWFLHYHIQLKDPKNDFIFNFNFDDKMKNLWTVWISRKINQHYSTPEKMSWANANLNLCKLLETELRLAQILNQLL